MLAGRDASRALATGELPHFKGLQSWDNLADLTPDQRDELNGWIDFFYSKYEQVGSLVETVSAEDEETEFTGHIMNI